MARIHSNKPVLGGFEHKILQYPSALPRSNSYSAEASTQTSLSSNMPMSNSIPRFFELSNPSDLLESPSSSSIPRCCSPGSPSEDNSNYVFGPSSPTFAAGGLPSQSLAIRGRCLEVCDSSSAYASTPSISELSPSPPPTSRRPFDLSLVKKEAESPRYRSENVEFCTETTRAEEVSLTRPSRKPCENEEVYSSDLDNSADEEGWDESEIDEETQYENKQWVDDVKGFETKVLKSVEYDLKAAASLIPQLYGILLHENSFAIGSWGTHFRQCSGHSGSSSQANPPAQESSGSSSDGNGKKRRSYEDGSDEGLGENQGGNGQDDGEQNSKRAKMDSSETQIRFACPFHKWKPDKYNAFHTAGEVGHPRYKACQGPGFSSISRLKYHLQNVHVYVQCLTCAQVFSGPLRNRATALESHQVEDERCQVNPQRELLREGISPSQWAGIDQVSKNVTSPGNGPAKPKTNVEKWMAIWAVLFPKEPKPKTPWYELHEPSPHSAMAKVLVEFSDCYDHTTEHELTEGRELHQGITPDEQTKNVFREIAIKAFRLHHTKQLVQGKLSVSPMVDSIPSDVHSSDTVTSANHRTENNSSAEETNKNYSQEAEQMMSAKQIGKQRVASSPENLKLQQVRCLRPTNDISIGMSAPFEKSSETIAGLTTGANYRNSSFRNIAPHGSFPQEFQPTPMNPNAEGTLYNGGQMPAQSTEYGSNVVVHPSFTGSAYGGLPDYPFHQYQDIPSADAKFPHDDGLQYHNDNTHSTYPVGQMIVPGGGLFHIPPNDAFHPGNSHDSYTSTRPNRTQYDPSSEAFWAGHMPRNN